MTLCNMSIEGGARAGLIAPDETTFAYIKGRPSAPKGEAWDMALDYWKTLHSDEGAHFDKIVVLDAAKLPPIVTWGTTPEDVVSVHGVVPEPGRDRGREQAHLQEARAGLYGPDRRHEDHRHQARPRLHRLLHQWPHRGPARRRQGGRGQEGRPDRRRHDRAGLGPGEGTGRGRRPRQDLHRSRLRLARAGLLDVPCHERRPAEAGERCASTSNRNFEGRQGFKGRTHLVSPAMAAAAAIAGHFVDIRDWN